MKVERRALERARRRDEILQAARAVFAEAGFGRATVEAVAERAEVGKGTIYLYFESKEAILAELLLQALAQLAGHLKTAAEARPVLHPEQRLLAMAEAYIVFAQTSPDFFRLLSAYDGGDLLQGVAPERRERILEQSNRTLELVTQAIADGMALGLFVPADARKTAGVMWAALNGALALMSHPLRRTMMSSDSASFCRATFDLLLRGITKECLAIP